MQHAQGRYIGDGTDARLIPTGMSGEVQTVMISVRGPDTNGTLTAHAVAQEEPGDCAAADGPDATGVDLVGADFYVNASSVNADVNRNDPTPREYIWSAWAS